MTSAIPSGDAAVLTPRWTGPTTPLAHSWEGIGNVDQFRWLARADLQAHLRHARDELGLRHVRAVAMYGPEQRVWARPLSDWRSKTDPPLKTVNWQLVDANIEGLLELGLKPVYTTCFCPGSPGDFTASSATCWPDKNAVGMPRDLVQWSKFVADGIRHHRDRFGTAEIASWYFECWNEPNLRGFFDGDIDDFMRLWSATWHAVKSVSPDLRIGGPSTARGEWLAEFLDWCERERTPPDYLISHVYNNDSEAAPLSPFDGPAADRVKDSPHFASGVVRGVRRMLDDRGWHGEVHWNEWGRSWFPHDPDRDGAREAAFIAKTLCECSSSGDRFAYWCLSDIYDQLGFSSSEFDGHYGMASLHGLRKPSWQAHRLMSRLGKQSVPVNGGDPLLGAVATVDDGAKILIWSYPATPGSAPSTDRVLLRLPQEPTTVRVRSIGAVDNNILAAWRAIGAPAYPTASQLSGLHASNRLSEISGTAVRDAEGWAVPIAIEKPGVVLVEAG